MKRKIVSVFLIAALVFGGCGAKESVSNNSANTSKSEISKNSVQMEIDKVEEESAKIDEVLQGDIPQLDMNLNAADMYDLWDKELNNIWSQLSDKLDKDKKDKLLNEQRQWIKRKEAEVVAAGIQCEGGSLQPFLESITGAQMTRARVYVLADILAKELGEDFVIPEEVQKDIEEFDVTLDKVFEKFEGVYAIDEENTKCIKVQKAEDSDFVLEDFLEKPEWIVSISNGEVLTDKDVVEYTSATITFHPVNGSGLYYQLRENIAGEVEIGFGDSQDSMDEAIVSY